MTVEVVPWAGRVRVPVEGSHEVEGEALAPPRPSVGGEQARRSQPLEQLMVIDMDQTHRLRHLTSPKRIKIQYSIFNSGTHSHIF